MFGITKEQLHELPEVTFPGRVIMVDSAAKAHDALRFLRRQPMIGFDTETRPSFQKDRHYTVSLMQLSTAQECFLFRLKLIGSLEGLMELMGDENVLKIGLSTRDDFNSLRRVTEVEPRGFVELQDMVKGYDIADLSLQKIYGVIFGQRISKTQRLTNWEAEQLTESQQRYAAIDAWACLRIYRHLCAGGFHSEECPFVLPDDAPQLQQQQRDKTTEGAVERAERDAEVSDPTVPKVHKKRRTRKPTAEAKETDAGGAATSAGREEAKATVKAKPGKSSRRRGSAPSSDLSSSTPTPQ